MVITDLSIAFLAVTVVEFLLMNKTSKGLMEFMKRKGLTPSGDSKVDIKTCRELKLFPFYICKRRVKK